ncbi:SEC-C motif-containing protein [Desulfocicer vacuolatum DSM 3385]|uniref:SEC-C motif-containing protein n=1 Tax=Desulfocicer vacuolatum DSM 3385 TaxID=1121400 RepID=A0A1W2A1N5_9BACT|nr:YchJ family protein [Desulfocicer vacuolatum]SMC54341.1 SEC-C motif-containing protein [Desulfocicer vacuolatum DSM 3385]
MSLCPCCSEKEFSRCCEPIIKGEIPAQTPEALMRSRYSAYVKGDIAYLKESTHPDDRGDFDSQATQDWSENSQWQKLEIITTDKGGPDDTEGFVEFIAFFAREGIDQKHHELASFKKSDNQWYFSDGNPVKPATVKRTSPKVGRNDPCPCGSGKKYKKCCA